MRLANVIAVSVLVFYLAISSAYCSQVQVYGVWHCGNDACIWATPRDMNDFDAKNHWLIDRGDGVPSVNVVVLSFVQPMKLLEKANDAQTANGLPIGISDAVVKYFTSHDVRVMLSIGGDTYTPYWDQALWTDPRQLGLNAAAVAKSLGVGIEIDYENDANPNLAGLQMFVSAYRSQIPYDPTGKNPAARLTIDLGEGVEYLAGLARYAAANWLSSGSPVLDYANAMVPDDEPTTEAAQSNWRQHITGSSEQVPAVPPLAPARFTGSLWLVQRDRTPECAAFSGSLIDTTGKFVTGVAPHGTGTTSGMLGYMFWAAECQGTHSVCVASPNDCKGGIGVGAQKYAIPVPMPPLRQD